MKKTNSFKLAMVAVGMLTIGTVSAQETDKTATTLEKNTDATQVVKSVDNKGTIKYTQGANGITTVTSTNAGNETVTTFQLGGELISATAITSDAQTGGTNTFAVKGIGQIDVSAAGLAKEENIFSTNADVNTKGFTFVVRDEATGEIKKITAEDIATFLVSIRAEGNPTAAPAAPTNSVDFNVPGLPLITPSTLGKLFVYRNGVKLRINTDFTATVAGKIEITNTDFPLYTTDMIEVQFTR
ncbi:hypothetical protein G1K66_03480 [Tenacibaculum finnmarkense]|uniref:hypothetical protein n=1 Tax=Tenacibaculum finnmarkense TaxID=2781243 RepID=UPI001EFB746F|nr:hypothetical protein [Tenacibaculum finnmarkense]MCG8812318.1 hypothetical protein [Tenacibaculum finnmarkense]